MRVRHIHGGVKKAPDAAASPRRRLLLRGECASDGGTSNPKQTCKSCPARAPAERLHGVTRHAGGGVGTGSGRMRSRGVVEDKPVVAVR